jgi:hypothetical protein
VNEPTCWSQLLKGHEIGQKTLAPCLVSFGSTGDSNEQITNAHAVDHAWLRDSVRWWNPASAGANVVAGMTAQALWRSWQKLN